VPTAGFRVLKSDPLFVPIAIATDPKHAEMSSIACFLVQDIAEIAVLPPSMLSIPPVSEEDLLPEILSGVARSLFSQHGSGSAKPLVPEQTPTWIRDWTRAKNLFVERSFEMCCRELYTFTQKQKKCFNFFCRSWFV
jgi:hypothetical protein